MTCRRMELSDRFDMPALYTFKHQTSVQNESSVTYTQIGNFVAVWARPMTDHSTAEMTTHNDMPKIVFVEQLFNVSTGKRRVLFAVLCRRHRCGEVLQKHRSPWLCEGNIVWCGTLF